MYNIILQNKTENTIDLYDQGSKALQNNELDTAQQAFEEAIALKENFKEAGIALTFIKESTQIEDDLNKAKTHQKNNEYEESILLVNEAESSLNDFNG